MLTGFDDDDGRDGLIFSLIISFSGYIAFCIFFLCNVINGNVILLHQLENRSMDHKYFRYI